MSTHSIRFSAGDHCFALPDHRRVLDLIAALGFDGVDLVLWEGMTEIEPSAVRRDIAGWAGRLDERVRSRGLEISDVVAIATPVHGPLALNHPDAEERRQSTAFFVDMLEFTRRVGAAGLSIQPGVAWPDESRGESLARAAAELRGRVGLAAEHGVRFSVEPYLGSVAETPDEVAALCNEVPGLELTLDPSHFVGFPAEASDKLIGRARHFHTRGASAEKVQVPLARSTLDQRRLFDSLCASGYEGFVEIEFCQTEWEAMDDVDVLTETLQLKREWERFLAAESGVSRR